MAVVARQLGNERNAKPAWIFENESIPTNRIEKQGNSTGEDISLGFGSDRRLPCPGLDLGLQ